MCDRLRKAVADMREYEKTGGDDNWYQWSEKFDALYAALDEEPPRQWVSLDGKELERCFHAASQHEWSAGYKWVLYRAIEQKLKEKNHD